jgi:hypothetical protein
LHGSNASSNLLNPLLNEVRRVSAASVAASRTRS